MKHQEVEAARRAAAEIMAAAGIAPAPGELIEIADFGLGRFDAEGLALVVRVNEPEYCSKWLMLTPRQECPTHYHKDKKETFFVLKGDVHLWIEDKEIVLNPGESYTIQRGVRHRFNSRAGAVVEEVSTHDLNSDNYFDNPNIVRDPGIDAG